MDIILQTADELFLDSIWATVAPALIHPVLTNKLSNTPLPSLSRFARDDIFRQSVSIYLITFGGIFVLYFTVATYLFSLSLLDPSCLSETDAFLSSTLTSWVSVSESIGYLIIFSLIIE